MCVFVDAYLVIKCESFLCVWVKFSIWLLNFSCLNFARIFIRGSIILWLFLQSMPLQHRSFFAPNDHVVIPACVPFSITRKLWWREERGDQNCASNWKTIPLFLLASSASVGRTQGIEGILWSWHGRADEVDKVSTQLFVVSVHRKRLTSQFTRLTRTFVLR